MLPKSLVATVLALLATAACAENSQTNKLPSDGTTPFDDSETGDDEPTPEAPSAGPKGTSSSAPPSAPATPATPATPTTPASGSRFASIAPIRLVDSRDGSGLASGAFAAALEPGVERALVIDNLDATLGPAANRTGFAISVTVTGTAGAGFLRAYPCGTDPEVSTLNFTGGESIAASAIVQAKDRICLKSSARTHVIVDALGTFTTVKGSSFEANTPRRVFDSRSAAATASYTIPIAGLPAGTKGVAAHVTLTGSAVPGYAAVHACGSSPSTSTVNFGAGETIGTTTIAEVGPGDALCITLSTAAHVLVDIESTFGGGKLSFVHRTPSRVFDSRGSAAATTYRFAIDGLPKGATTAAISLIATGPAVPGYAWAHPCDAPNVSSSSVNVNAGATRASLSFAPLNAAGEVCVSTSTPMHVVADAFGVLAP